MRLARGAAAPRSGRPALLLLRRAPAARPPASQSARPPASQSAAPRRCAAMTSFYDSAVARRDPDLPPAVEVLEIVASGAAMSCRSDVLLRHVESPGDWAHILGLPWDDDAATVGDALGFAGKAGQLVSVPTKEHRTTVFVGTGTSRRERIDAFAAASATVAAMGSLPHRVTCPLERAQFSRRKGGGGDDDAAVVAATAQFVEDAALGWILGAYAFNRYKTTRKPGQVWAPANLTIIVVVARTAAAAAERRPGWPATEDGATMALLRQAVGRAALLGSVHCWARDLTNAPACDLGPAELAAEAVALARAHAPAARIALVRGDDLLARGWPLVHAVGRASARPPVLVDLSWQPPDSSVAAAAAANAPTSTSTSPPRRRLPLLVLCGKGVCFDTGGLSLKTSAGMRLMKKDMGGAALVLALAALIMHARLPVRLRVLVPCVENAVGGDANRLGDVLRSRLGLTVEQLNTDAEGRLVLADALAEACGPDCAAPFGPPHHPLFPPGHVGQWATAGESDAARRQRWRCSRIALDPFVRGRPDLVIDVATLTGAARVALGPEVPAVFSNDEAAWRQLEAAAEAEGDPVWRLPLHAPYARMLESKVADLSNVPADATGHAGAIVAALFLKAFVRQASKLSGEHDDDADPSPPWLHVDTAGWRFSGSAGPGRPEGGEPLALRALWRMLRERYPPGPEPAAPSSGSAPKRPRE